MKSNGVELNNGGAPMASTPRRRGLLLGAGVVGVAAIAARTLPTTTAEVAAVPAAKKVDDKTGYQETQHVLRYYETAKV
jgi:hypothetical protein